MMYDPAVRAIRDQRQAAYRDLAETARDLFVAFHTVGFQPAEALELTMQLLEDSYDLRRREM